MFLSESTRLLEDLSTRGCRVKMIWGKTVRAHRTGGHLLTGRQRFTALRNYVLSLRLAPASDLLLRLYEYLLLAQMRMLPT